jgi:hypothetical protein
MRCYNHRDRDAVGLCKSCGKGLCDECQTDLGQGLACKNRCEETVRGLIALVHHNVRAVPTARVSLRWSRWVWVGIGLFILTPGCVFTVLGVLDSRLRILILLGGMLCVFGILALVFAWTLPGFPKNGSSGNP